MCESCKAEKIDLDENLADREIVAKFAEEHLFTDEATIERLCNTDPTLFERIRYWISDMIVKLKGTEEQKFFLEAEKLYKKALASRGETAGAGAEQHAIAVLDDGKTYVTASRNIINSQTKDGMRNDITNFFNKLLDGNKSLDIQTLEGDVLTITKADTAFKARDDARSVNGIPVKMSDAEFAVKLNAEAHIDELAETAIKNKKPYEADTKNHAFAKDGFEYRTAYFQDFDGQYYKLGISIGHNGNVATIYNVGKIIKSASPSANLIAVVGSTAPGETLLNKNIPQTPPAVNNQHSAGLGFEELERDTAYSRALNTGDMETAQKLVDEAAKEAGYSVEAYHGTDAEYFTVFDKGRIGNASGKCELNL